MKYTININIEILANSEEEAVEIADSCLDNDGYIYEIKKCITKRGENGREI